MFVALAMAILALAWEPIWSDRGQFGSRGRGRKEGQERTGRKKAQKSRLN